MTRQTYLVTADGTGQRLDRWLTEHLADVTRSRIQELIAECHVLVNDAAVKPSHKLAMGERVVVDVAALSRPALRVEPEDIPLEILYEDEDVVVINKPAGMVVHAGAGQHAQQGTLVNALLGRYQRLSSGSEPGGLRPGIVHRLDKDTSGCIVVARNDRAHALLAEQFERRRVQKTYLALLQGEMKPQGKIELPIARDVKRRTRMTASAGRGRAARTDWKLLLKMEQGSARKKAAVSVVAIQLHSGRTHQIRVHFSTIGHPVVGDELYGAQRRLLFGRETLPPLGRNFLHAARILFYHPRTNLPVEVHAPLPAELKNFLERIAAACGVGPEKIDAALRGYL